MKRTNSTEKRTRVISIITILVSEFSIEQSSADRLQYISVRL